MIDPEPDEAPELVRRAIEDMNKRAVPAELVEDPGDDDEDDDYEEEDGAVALI